VAALPILNTEFTASRKEPLVEMYDRVLAAFLSSGLGEPEIQFSFADAPTLGFTSSVARVLKRFPAMESFCSETAPMSLFPVTRRISNQGSGAEFDRETLRAILTGVPRSFPWRR
jgi:hypothetical protein